MSLREPIFLASCIELAVLIGSTTSEFRFAECEFRYHADLVGDFLERCRGGVVIGACGDGHSCWLALWPRERHVFGFFSGAANLPLFELVAGLALVQDSRAFHDALAKGKQVRLWSWEQLDHHHVCIVAHGRRGLEGAGAFASCFRSKIMFLSEPSDG